MQTAETRARDKQMVNTHSDVAREQTRFPACAQSYAAQVRPREHARCLPDVHANLMMGGGDRGVPGAARRKDASRREAAMRRLRRRDENGG